MKFAKKTRVKMDEYKKNGYEIKIGNNPFMNRTKKWANHDLVCLAQTNSRSHGFSVRTVWAVRKIDN